MRGLYKVSGYIGAKYFEVDLKAEGIAEAIDLAVQHCKRIEEEEVDICAVRRIDEYN